MAKSVTVNGPVPYCWTYMPFFFPVGWGFGMSSHAQGLQEKSEHKKNGWLPANVPVTTVAVPMTHVLPRRGEEGDDS